MQKIYVLLRHDQQTAPYSLEEITQFDLKPYDLIWIEGASAGWYYPQEIAALHPYLSFLPKKAATVRQPGNVNPMVAAPIAVKAGLPPVTAPETVAPFVYSSKPASENIEEKVYAQFRSVEREPSAATATPAFSKKSQVPSLAVAMAVVLVVGFVFAASWMMNRQPEEQQYTALAEPVAEIPVQGAGQPSAAATGSRATSDPSGAARSNTANRKGAGKQTLSQAKQNRSTEAEMTSAIPDRVSADKPAVVVAEENSKQGAEEEEKPLNDAAEPVEKKKKLREKFLDLFKKKPEEQQQGEAEKAEPARGERTSTRRESGAELAQMVHVRFTVPNEWMMGIHGAKATLVNRSSETITKASVEVQYYNDDNELLQKKIISFGKIEAKGTQTIAIPDHPSATKVDYSVIAVTGKPAA